MQWILFGPCAAFPTSFTLHPEPLTWSLEIMHGSRIKWCFHYCCIASSGLSWYPIPSAINTAWQGMLPTQRMHVPHRPEFLASKTYPTGSKCQRQGAKLFDTRAAPVSQNGLLSPFGILFLHASHCAPYMCMYYMCMYNPSDL